MERTRRVARVFQSRNERIKKVNSGEDVNKVARGSQECTNVCGKMKFDK